MAMRVPPLPPVCRRPAVLLALALLPPLASAGAGAVPELISETSHTLTTVNYTDPYDNVTLMGYIATPNDASSDDRRGAVIVLPNWDGVNEEEQIRAGMFADRMGYVSLAADVYGAGENHQAEEIDERIEMATKVGGDLDLSASRIKSAIEVLRGMETVDLDRGLGMVGICLGGSLALNYALMGHDDGVDGVVSWHGSLLATEAAGGPPNITVIPKVLIQSGGEDDQDSTKSVMDMEAALNAGNATWEIGRYSGVEHGFTSFDSDAYNPYVDGRTWHRTTTFLAEAFGDVELAADVPETVNTIEVKYMDVDGTELTGHASLPPSATIEPPQLHPAVVIIHDASGLDDYERTRAQMLADMGYIGFAADTFGDHGLDLTNGTQRSSLIGEYRNNVTLFVQRIRAGIAAAKSLDGVDLTKIALIGYCMGGTGIINYALVGESEATAIVSYHGGLSTLAPTGTPINVRMMIQSGGDDDESSEIEDLEEAMELGGAPEWEYARYSDVEHAFTVWDDARGRYNARADVRSWESMTTFLQQAFADVVETDGNETKAANKTEAATEGDALTPAPVVVNGTVPVPAPSAPALPTAPGPKAPTAPAPKEPTAPAPMAGDATPQPTSAAASFVGARGMISASFALLIFTCVL